MKKWLKVLSLVIVAAFPPTKIQAQSANEVVPLDPGLDQIISADAKVEKLAGDFAFVEGPVWVRQGKGYLLFSDIPADVINKWTPDGTVSVFLKPSGFTGRDSSDVGGVTNNGYKDVINLGSNGLALDRQSRVVFAAQGDRAVVRLEKTGKRTILADRFEGKRLNSPNDLVVKSDGALYFTDPPFGLRKSDADPKKELPFNGVFLLRNGNLQLLDQTFKGPNGLAFSPDEKYLYVNDSTRKLIIRYEVKPDDTIANGQLFIDMTLDPAPGVPDGMKVDQKGDVYCTGPGGFWIMSPEGKHLGTLKTPELPANLAFGDADAKTLYLTARTGLYRMRLKVSGIHY